MAYSNARPRMAVAAVAGLQTEQIFLTPVEGSGFDLALPPGVRDWEGSIWDYYRQLYPSLASQPPDEAAVQAWEEPAPEPPPPLTDVEIAKSYAQAYQAAQDIIFLLMSRVSTALVVGKHFTPETVNKEGTRFTRYHQAEIEAFKLSGRHPDAGDALYAAVEASAGEFPWLKKEDNILSIFATTLLRNPT